jgi:hypothetical protein
MSKGNNWLCTYNNPDTSMVEEYLSKWFHIARATYVNGQLERGANGTVHIQYFLNFKQPVRMAALKKHC